MVAGGLSSRMRIISPLCTMALACTKSPKLNSEFGGISVRIGLQSQRHCRVIGIRNSYELVGDREHRKTVESLPRPVVLTSRNVFERLQGRFAFEERER